MVPRLADELKIHGFLISVSICLQAIWNTILKHCSWREYVVQLLGVSLLLAEQNVSTCTTYVLMESGHGSNLIECYHVSVSCTWVPGI